MIDDLLLFSETEGNMLIRLLVAHLLADFMFQGKKMVANKKWLSGHMLLHTGIVYITTSILTGWWLASIIIMILHYIADGVKFKLESVIRVNKSYLFITDQLFHIIVIITVWASSYGLYENIYQLINKFIASYNFMLLLMGYLFITFPLGYLIGIAIKRLQSINTITDRNGLMIGIFERIIILTFMLLEQYEAIGFLITGKSIIRFSSANEEKNSEYVLLGTMVSYGITILTGIILKLLIVK